MNLIVAVDENWAIGCRGDLLVRIPADHKMFRQETTGKVVVLGRKTMDTFPGGQPLKNRTNIVLSRNPQYTQKDAIVVHSVEELLEKLKEYDTQDVYIIGGSSVYAAAVLRHRPCDKDRPRLRGGFVVSKSGQGSGLGDYGRQRRAVLF